MRAGKVGDPDLQVAPRRGPVRLLVAFGKWDNGAWRRCPTSPFPAPQPLVRVRVEVLSPQHTEQQEVVLHTEVRDVLAQRALGLHAGVG